MKLAVRSRDSDGDEHGGDVRWDGGASELGDGYWGDIIIILLYNYDRENRWSN